MPRTVQLQRVTRQMPMFQCNGGSRYEGGCNAISPADQIVSKTKHRLQREGYDAAMVNAVPDLNEHTPKVVRMVCPHCNNWRSLSNNNMRFVGYSDIEVVEN